MSFAILPPEILAAVLVHVRPAELVTFASLTKTCFALSKSRLKEHRQRQKEYSILINDGCMEERQLVRAIRNILIEPVLGDYVRNLMIRSIPWADVLDDGENGSQRSDELDQQNMQEFCRKRLFRLGLWRTSYAPDLTHVHGQWNEDTIFGNSASVVAMMLPLFSNLRNICFKLDDEGRGLKAGLDTIAYVLRKHLQHHPLPAFQYSEAYSSLTNVDIDLDEDPFVFDSYPSYALENVVPFLSLPHLQILRVPYVSSADFDRVQGHREHLSQERTTAQLLTKAPLRELSFEASNASAGAFSQLFSLIEKDSLASFKFDLFYMFGRWDSAKYESKKLIQALESCARNSLETLELSIDDECVRYDIARDSISNLERGPAAFDHSSLAHYTLDATTNLANFTRLKEIIIDAELLLNGFGIQERVQKSREPVVNGLDSVELEHREEPSPFGAPPLYGLLPASLEVLHVHCTVGQGKVFRENVERLTGNLAAGARPRELPALREVRLNGGSAVWMASGLG